MLIVFGVIILVAIGFFYAYMNGLASAWAVNKPDERPFFITIKPIAVKRIMLPKGTKLIYQKQYFWEKYEQKEPLNEKDIEQISFMDGTTLSWGGVLITSIVKFHNPEMRGFTVCADFNKLDKKNQFSNLWQNCSNDLGITIKDKDDWSFNKKNILDVNSCGVNYQRYFKEDEDQQRYLDDLYNELMIIKE